MKDNSENIQSGPRLHSNAGINESFTHVECDSDDVEAHGGVSDAAEGRRLKRQEDHSTCEDMSIIRFFFQQRKWRLLKLLTRSILASLCLRRRRLCLRINCEEELCSVELLSLKKEHKRSKNQLKMISLLCKAQRSHVFQGWKRVTSLF